MAYNGLTNTGAIYLATRQANNLPVEFLKAKVGDGVIPAGTDPIELTNIISEKMEVEISNIQQTDRTLKMTVQVSNESLTTGFYLTEIAIFVNDNGTPVLYWYIGKDNGTYVPDSTKPMKYKNILNIEVSSTPVTTVNYTGKDLWVDEDRLEEELDKKLDKGLYEGTAEKLDNDKYNKSGGKLTGTVNIDTPAGTNSSRIDFKTGGVQKGYVGRIENVTKGYIGLHNYIIDKYMRIFDDGTAEIGAGNLNTPTKEVITAINEEFTFITNNSGRKIGDLFYIQNVGTKIIGQYYFDRNTYGLYKCLNTTTSVNNDSNFVDDSNFAIALLARDNQSKVTNLNKTDYLYSGPFSGAGTFTITNILKYNLIQLTIIVSTSDTITTHEQYSVCFTPTTKFDWGRNQHVLGAIAISVTAGMIYISGAGAQYVKIKEIYGIGKKEA